MVLLVELLVHSDAAGGTGMGILVHRGMASQMGRSRDN